MESHRTRETHRTKLIFVYFITFTTAHVIKAAVDTLVTVFGPQQLTLKKIGFGNSEKKAKDQLRAVKFAPGYQLTFSLFSGDASNGIRSWKMQEAISGMFTYSSYSCPKYP